MPGQGADGDESVWLPIDAKFPIEDHQRLIDAQERADSEGVEAAGKQLENRVKASGKSLNAGIVDVIRHTDDVLTH